jgi:LEA14-like dessication related protein
MSISGFSTGKILKWTVLFVVLICVAGTVYFFLSGRKPINLVFPDLEEIYSVNSEIKHDSAHTHLRLVLQNKNPYSLNIDTLAFDVSINDTSIAHQTVPLNIRQTWFKSDTVRIPLNTSIKKIGSLLKHLRDRDSTMAEANGYIVYETFYGRAKFNFSKRKKISVPIPPEIKLISLARDKFDLKTKTIRVNTKFEIRNMSKKIDLQLWEISYALNINDELHSKGTLNKTLDVRPQSTVPLSVPMLIKVDHPLKTKLMIITDRDRLPYTLFVTFMAKERISQKKYNSPVELKVSGEMELEK